MPAPTELERWTESHRYLQSEASRQPVSGLLYDSRISGGILADGVNGLLSALFTNAPLSIFAQNNGVIR